MKNIIWQQGDGSLAYFAYADDVDTQALALTIKAAGGVDADWEAVAFDRDLPTVRQDTWRFVGGEFTFVAPPSDSKEQQIAHVLATQGKGKDRTLIQQVISFAEMVAAPLLAAQYGVSLELAIMGIYARNKTYRECKDAETACEAIEDAP